MSLFIDALILLHNIMAHFVNILKESFVTDAAPPLRGEGVEGEEGGGVENMGNNASTKSHKS